MARHLLASVARATNKRDTTRLQEEKVGRQMENSKNNDASVVCTGIRFEIAGPFQNRTGCDFRKTSLLAHSLSMGKWYGALAAIEAHRAQYVCVAGMHDGPVTM